MLWGLIHSPPCKRFCVMGGRGTRGKTWACPSGSRQALVEPGGAALSPETPGRVGAAPGSREGAEAQGGGGLLHSRVTWALQCHICDGAEL